jgi:hypothetical protein
VARAKRTDRADARRRYRQAQVDPTEGELDEGGQEPTPATTRRSAASTPAAGRRMGFTDAMRVAFHRPDLRSDIAALPWLLRTRGFLIPLALVLVGMAAVFIAPSNPAAGFFFQLIVLPPAMAPIFIVGFFAKRASYLLGFIIAVIDTAGYLLFVYGVMPALATTPLDPARQQELAFSAIAVGPLSGVAFASGAAWYRRFLALTGGQRPRKPAPSQRAKGRPARS